MVKRKDRMVAVRKVRAPSGISRAALARAIRTGVVLTAKVNGRRLVSMGEVRAYFRGPKRPAVRAPR